VLLQRNKIIKSQSSLKLNIIWLADRLQIDRTVIYGILANSWSIIAGPITMLMIISHFSSELQGYYYTFNNIIALRVFVELGLGTVIISFASHEWAKLSLDGNGNIEGDVTALSRLVSLGRLVFKWYFVGGFIALIGLGLGGYLFFLQEKSVIGISWALPWFVLCSLTAINMWLAPALFLLEGSNQIKRLYYYRMVQGICISICTWTAIALGAGLWAVIVNAAVSIICLIMFLFIKYRNYFKSIIFHATTAKIDWRDDLWPMQWRISLSWISGYFLSAFFTPLIFHYHGPVAAGQFGMTWSLFVAVGTFSNIWLATKRPQFGMLIAKKDYYSLDKLFFRTAALSIGIYILGVIALWLLIYFLYFINHPWAVRVLSPLPAGIFIIGLIFRFSTAPFSYYLRAHNRDPLYLLDVTTAVILATAAFILGKHYAALGIAIVYTGGHSLFSFPASLWGWYKCRLKWHSTY